MASRKKATAAAHDSHAVACTSEQKHLGEGARWDARRDELLRVDIPTPRAIRKDVSGPEPWPMMPALEAVHCIGSIDADRRPSSAAV